LTNGVKFAYVGGNTSRANLFEKFGMTLKLGKIDETDHSEIILEKTNEFIQEFITIVRGKYE